MKNFTQFHKSARNNRTNFAALCEFPLANWIRWLNIGNWAYGHRRHVINIRAGFLPHLSIVRFTFWSRRITMTISSRATLAGCCEGRKFDPPWRTKSIIRNLCNLEWRTSSSRRAHVYQVFAISHSLGLGLGESWVELHLISISAVNFHVVAPSFHLELLNVRTEQLSESILTSNRTRTFEVVIKFDASRKLLRYFRMSAKLFAVIIGSARDLLSCRLVSLLLRAQINKLHLNATSIESSRAAIIDGWCVISIECRNWITTREANYGLQRGEICWVKWSSSIINALMVSL